LGDLGADVIKVERPGRGEETRNLHPKVGGESLYAMIFNRNKRGMTLNFRDPKGQELLRELMGVADVLIENFRPGTLEKMGCGWDVAQELNPKLIMVRVSGFGQDGPHAERPCFDVIAQALSGLMEMTGQPDGPPTMAGTFVVDYVTALYATIGTAAAVQARAQTGRGQLVDVSLLESAVSLLMTAVPEKLLFDRDSARRGNRDRYAAPANTFRAMDGGWVHIAAAGDALFSRAAAAMGREDLLGDPRFATASARMENLEAIEAVVAEWVGRHDADAVAAAMDAAAVPCAKIATIADVISNPQLLHRGQVVELPHPTAGNIPSQGLPIRLSATPASIRCAAPSVGEQTYEVLADWLGLDRERIDALARDGVV
jgi:crotonobetainyl-CoA:carnitine CoA-transferase CaiB-like acyl-CoA transferase